MNERSTFRSTAMEWLTARTHLQMGNRFSLLKWILAHGGHAGWYHSMARVRAKQWVPPQPSAQAVPGRRMGTGCIFPRMSETDFIFGRKLFLCPSKLLLAPRRNRGLHLRPTGDHLLQRSDPSKARFGFTIRMVNGRLLRSATLFFLRSRTIKRSFIIWCAPEQAHIL